MIRANTGMPGAAWSRAALGVLLLMLALPAHAAAHAALLAWWVWPVALFVTCFAIGIVAVPAGIGGGTLFVPIVGSLFPFHLDFVRGAGTLVALASALSAGPFLLRNGLADLRLALPPALAASIGAVAGAMMGMALPPSAIQMALGITVLGIVALMLSPHSARLASEPRPDRLAAALALSGNFLDSNTRRMVPWQAQRTARGLAVFVVIGVMGGLFGIGAGWANVPALHLLMGVPLKVATGSSSLVLSIASSSAAWVYVNQGAVLPLIAVPAILGMSLGAHLGARLLHVLPAHGVRRMVIGVLLLAGLRALLKGAGIWE